MMRLAIFVSLSLWAGIIGVAQVALREPPSASAKTQDRVEPSEVEPTTIIQKTPLPTVRVVGECRSA